MYPHYLCGFYSAIIAYQLVYLLIYVGVRPWSAISHGLGIELHTAAYSINQTIRVVCVWSFHVKK